MNIKNKIKPKTKRRRNIIKNRIKRYRKRSFKRSQDSKTNTNGDSLEWWGYSTIDDEQEGIVADEHGRRTYPEHGDFDQFHLQILKGFTWEGMVTIKFHHHEYSGDDRLGFARDRRFNFGNQVMENLCNRWFGVKKGQMVWAITDEFGESGEGHIHIVFSFDNLSLKARERVQQIDFKDGLGVFRKYGENSCDFVRMMINNDRSILIRRNQINFNWRSQWHNEGLCRYMTKLEWGRPDKQFNLHNIIPIESALLVTK